MRKRYWVYSLMCLLLTAHTGWALRDTSQYLIVESEETVERYGDIYRSVSICVKSGGCLKVVPNYIKGAVYKVNLISPCIQIDGTILADAISLSITGRGQSGTGLGGDGGGGYGGIGGTGGVFRIGDTGGTGGIVYNTAYRENYGSTAANVNSGTFQGYGGGVIRLDAISLTISASAKLYARGGRQGGAASGRLGGGSGGSIYLEGIHTWLESACELNVRGGDGQGQTMIIGAGGGGGGSGRIKVIKQSLATFVKGTLTLNITGGLGGRAASNGGTGFYSEYTALVPNVPTLISPTDDQLVGRSPTLNFNSTDIYNSKFFKYKLEISDSVSFSTIVLAANQAQSSTGWTKAAYYSNEIAGYTVTSPLDFNQVYYWRVAVSNNNGISFTGWSSSRYFRTVNNTPPLIPVLIQPGNGVSQQSKLPVFQVCCADPEGNSLSCSLLLAQDESMTNPQVFLSTYPGWDQSFYLGGGAYLGVTATCQLLNSELHLDALDPGITYYWKVVVYDQYQESNESGVYHFTTIPRPTMPNRFSPLNNTILTSKNPTLRFSSTSPTMSLLTYKLEMSSDNYQTVVTYLSENGGGWSKQAYASGEEALLFITSANSLVSGNSYAWRVASYDQTNDNWSEMTDAWQFIVVTPPMQPELLAPMDHFQAPDQSPTFHFQAASESGNTLTYRLELSEDHFQTVLHNFEQALDTTGWGVTTYASNSPAAFAFPAAIPLKRGQEYSWRVSAFDTVSWGPLSEIRFFQISNTLDIGRCALGPNPAVAVEQLRIFLQTSVDAQVTIRIYNKLGKELDEWTVSALGGAQGNEYPYRIANFAPGVYYCVLEIKSGYGEKKIVKRFAVVN